MKQKVDFDRYAGSYDQALNSALKDTGESKDFYADGRMRWLARALARQGFKPQRVLDFGCGTGSSTLFIQKYLSPARIYGVDVSVASLETAKDGHPSAEFIVLGTAEADALSGLDLVFCNGVFHHIPVSEREHWLEWIHARMNTGAIFALFENNPWNPGTRYVMSNCEFDADAICLPPPETRSRLKLAGFELLRTESLFFFPRALKSLRWLEPALRKLPLGGQYVCLARKASGKSFSGGFGRT